jgi:hypothetical protein
VRAFACPHCHALLFFDNSVCVTCGSNLGFLRDHATLVRLEPGSDGTLNYSDGDITYTRCGNSKLAECNWLASGPNVTLCSCCELTQTRPSNDDVEGMASFARTEAAKRRLVYQLDSLGLPTTSRTVDPEHGLAFDLLSSADGPVITGHSSGVITIDLAEGDDPHREALRASLGEPYRTLLGHLRHEIGHWYWDVLVDPVALGPFRDLFGDERADYAQALSEHYGSPHDESWRATYISSYAAAHPWEDWAESFAHYLHMADTLQTASAYRLRVAGPDLPLAAAAVNITAAPLDSYADFDAMLADWLALTYALNAVNRSMGKDDLYPFVLVPAVIDKLRFVHEVVIAPALTAR